MNRINAFLLAALALALSLPPLPLKASPAASPTVAGEWVTPGGDSLIRIEGTNTLSFTLLAVRGGESLTDRENPDPELRQRTLSGLQLGAGFERAGNEWSGGKLYDPGTGNTYNARIRRLGPNRVEVRGYVGLPAFGRTEVWTRKSLFTDQIRAMLAAGGER